MTKNYKLYKVGGCVRDALLGVQSKDIDFTFEFQDKNAPLNMKGWYEEMNDILTGEGFEIFLEVPEAFTTRARFPVGHQYEKLTADFVLARKESYPNPETRMPVVEIGTLYDDLKRRDFTVNAIAEDEDGNLIDPFDGQGALKKKTLRCPVDAKTSFNDDPLRMLRALRFSITKKLFMSPEILKIITTDIDMWNKFAVVVSQERIREELLKMMKFNTVDSIALLVEIDRKSPVNILKRIFGEDMWLIPTTKQIKKQKANEKL